MINPKIQKLKKTIGFPLVVLLIVVVLVVLWKMLDLPSREEVINLTQLYFQKYGPVIIGISAFAEGLLLLGWYYPGSMAMILGIIFADGDFFKIAEVILVVLVSTLAACIIDFLFGKYGWYRLLLALGLKKPLEGISRRLEKNGLKTLMLTFWQPNLAGISSTAAGILQFSFRQFLKYAFLAILYWSILWSVLVYFLGERILVIVDIRIGIVLILAWIVYRLITNKLSSKAKVSS